MNKKLKILALLSAVLLFANFVAAKGFQSTAVKAQTQGSPVNQIVLDVTYNPSAKTYSIAGFSYAQLRVLGMPELEQLVSYIVDNLQSVVENLQLMSGYEFITDKEGLEQVAWNFLDAFETISITLNNSEISLKVDGVKVISIPWNQATRQTLFSSINDNIDRIRIEEWLSVADLVLNINNSPRVSHSLVINLSTPFKVDVSTEGAVSVEGYDTGIVQPEIYNTSQLGGVDNTTLCWSQGNIFTTVNGNSLPQITIYKDGVEVIDKALNLGMGDLEPFYNSELGVSVSFGGAEHEITYCGK